LINIVQEERMFRLEAVLHGREGDIAWHATSNQDKKGADEETGGEG
jgi:hypothetical protein